MLESKDFLKLYDDVFDETGKVKMRAPIRITPAKPKIIN